MSTGGIPQALLDNLAALVPKPGGAIYTATASLYVTPSITTVSTKILSANSNRKGLIVYNNSANSIYMCFTGPATSAGCHKILATFATWEVYGPCIWTGDLYAIRNSGSGALNLVEFT